MLNIKITVEKSANTLHFLDVDIKANKQDEIQCLVNFYVRVIRICLVWA